MKKAQNRDCWHVSIFNLLLCGQTAITVKIRWNRGKRSHVVFEYLCLLAFCCEEGITDDHCYLTDCTNSRASWYLIRCDETKETQWVSSVACENTRRECPNLGFLSPSTEAHSQDNLSQRPPTCDNASPKSSTLILVLIHYPFTSTPTLSSIKYHVWARLQEAVTATA